MRKSNDVYLKEILDYMGDIESYLNNIKMDGFETNGLLQDGVIRKIELIGEVARKLSRDFWVSYEKELPLAKAVAMRNKMIHEYDDVDLKIIWNTVKKDLPELKKKIKEILR